MLLKYNCLMSRSLAYTSIYEFIVYKNESITCRCAIAHIIEHDADIVAGICVIRLSTPLPSAWYFKTLKPKSAMAIRNNFSLFYPLLTWKRLFH